MVATDFDVGAVTVGAVAAEAGEAAHPAEASVRESSVRISASAERSSSCPVVGSAPASPGSW